MSVGAPEKGHPARGLFAGTEKYTGICHKFVHFCLRKLINRSTNLMLVDSEPDIPKHKTLGFSDTFLV